MPASVSPWAPANVGGLVLAPARSNYDDRDADDEARSRLAAQRDRGSFSAVQVFAAGPGDDHHHRRPMVILLGPSYLQTTAASGVSHRTPWWTATTDPRVGGGGVQ